MYKYILFDLDGTLTDPKLGITSCVQYALHKFGIEEPDRDKLEPFIGPPLLDSFQEFYGFDEEKGLQAVAYYRERFSTVGLFENEIYPGIAQMLARLQKAGCRLAVASSKPTVFVTQILEHFGILSYFEVIVGSELDGTRSRKEEVVEEALRQLLRDGGGEEEACAYGIVGGTGMEKSVSEAQDWKRTGAGWPEPEDILCGKSRHDIAMVGDRKYDIMGAKTYHIDAVGVAYGYAAAGELEAAGADVIVATVGELEKALAQ